LTSEPLYEALAVYWMRFLVLTPLVLIAGISSSEFDPV